MKLTNELMSKVERSFAGKDMILTGQGGLGRKQLRVLERHKIIESKMFRNKNTGVLIRGWQLVSSGFIKKDLTADKI